LTILYLDCFAGVAGDMFLGALIDAGVPLEDVRRALGSLAIDRETVWTERVVRAGISATKFQVRGETPVHDHAHDHEQGHDHRPDTSDHPRDPVTLQHEERHHHVHRTLADIFRLIDGSSLSGGGKDRAKAMFTRLGEAEAAIHATTLEAVHLHEVAALDSIVDIVGTVHAMETLGVERVVASPVNVGSGTIRSAHGVYPVPTPATVRLLADAPIYSGPQQTEMTTPTGALLVTSYADSFGPVPAMRVSRIGYGAGSREFRDFPNVLRALVGQADAPGPSHTVVVIEAEIDDMNPQIFGLLMDRLLAEGALDVFYTAIQMKKNRPGTLLTIIASVEGRERLTATVFRETTTIGVRYREMTRECLERESVDVQTPLGTVRFKVARRDGRVLNASPEFDDCARIARERDLPLKDVQAAAMKAFLDRRP
jgi:pyridinium-3,5-bisthiocarboxylic acid mononucleotide nickel chelatase